MYQVMWTVEIWLGTRQSSAHASTAQMELSMCSSRYCFTFAPLFSLFLVVVVIWDSLTFSFYFFDIFSTLRSTKEVTIENMNLNEWKAWPVENSEDMLKIDKNLVTMKRGSRDQFLAKIKIFKTRLFHFCSSLFFYFWSINIFLGFFDFFLLFLWYFFFILEHKKVTTENMSLNKWKAWPMENSEDVLKINKKLGTTKRGSCDQFLPK